MQGIQTSKREEVDECLGQTKKIHTSHNSSIASAKTQAKNKEQKTTVIVPLSYFIFVTSPPDFHVDRPDIGRTYNQSPVSYEE